MTYELALKLKEAGFKQDILGWRNSKDKISVVCPELSELIEACGVKIQSLHNLVDLNRWDALSQHFKGLGATPEEAVANLWLALNKKDA